MSMLKKIVQSKRHNLLNRVINHHRLVLISYWSEMKIKLVMSEGVTLNSGLTLNG